LSYCPRSSLPVEVLAWLACRLAHLLPPRPPGRGGTRPLSLEVRLDAVGAVLLDGLSYRRAGRMVGISKTEVGDSIALLLGETAKLGICQPDGTFVTNLADLAQRLAEMAASASEGRPAGSTRAQWPLARGWSGGMLTGVGQQAPGTPGQTGKSRGCPGWIRRADRSEWDGGDTIDMPPELPGGPPCDRVRPNAPLRRLTSIRDGTPHGGDDSLADPTMAARPISRRSVAFP
jgi:hypothetical protein